MDTSCITIMGRTWTGGIADDAVWQHRWRRLTDQSASWYARPSGAVGCRFTAILAAEWRGFLVGVGTLRDPSSLTTLFL